LKQDINSCRLYVGNIDFEDTPDSLRALFERVGTVVDVYMPTVPTRKNSTGKRNEGYAFVEMSRVEDAQRSCEEFNNQLMDGSTGRRLKVTNAHDRQGRR
jgi:RNA recognition motif-containing protein